MFTGLIEAVGTVRAFRRSAGSARLEIAVLWPDEELLRPGESVGVDGACLTVIDPNPDGFAADLSPETLAHTRFSKIRPGATVNLERALRVGDRLGGHLVQGHVDAVVRLLAVVPEARFSRWRVELPQELAGQLARKGSVALDGVSLTVAEVGKSWFEVALIPETLRATTLGARKVGASLHLETDLLAKYVARATGGDTTKSSILEEFLSGDDRAAH